MSRCAEPGEPGFILALFLGYGINVAIRLAGEVGTGLPLVNALRDRFPEIEIGLAGSIAGIVGAGGRAMAAFNTGPTDGLFDPESMPSAGNVFFEDSPGERYMLRAHVWISADGIVQPDPKTVVLYTTEPLTLEQAVSQIIEQFGETESPDGKDKALIWQAESVQFYFGMRRF